MLAAVSLFLTYQAQLDPASLLFARPRLSCEGWARAANYYIGLGEQDACTDLLRRAGKSKLGGTRAALICRILYEPKGKGALRPPKFGDLSLPHLPLSAWPEFPLFQQDGVWFELDENFRSSEVPERVDSYIEYCQKNGRFRTERLALPTPESARDALKSLQGSKRWKAIVWSDSDRHNSYTYDPGWTLDLLRSQTRFNN
jgi:hypothetical protein